MKPMCVKQLTRSSSIGSPRNTFRRKNFDFLVDICAIGRSPFRTHHAALLLDYRQHMAYYLECIESLVF